MTKMNQDNICGKPRCLCSIPLELLQLILERLSIIDYVYCRAVCRCWRISILHCPVSFRDQTNERAPWVVFLRAAKVQMLIKVKTPLRTIGKLGNSFTRRVYSFPELSGKLFLLSKYGWLLLFSDSLEQPSLFFLNPFSRARINLPFIDVSSLHNPAFGISSPPTSQSCTVFIISCVGDEIDTNGMKVNMCVRGKGTWTTRVYTWTTGVYRSPYPITPFVVNMAFARGVFYCLHQGGHLSAFTVTNSKWVYLMGPNEMGLPQICRLSTLISQIIHYLGEIYLRIECDFPYRLLYITLKDPPEFVHEAESLEWKIKDMTLKKRPGVRWDPMELIDDENLVKWVLASNLLIRRYPGKAFLTLGTRLKFDSYGDESWYGVCDYEDEEGSSTFNWCTIVMWPTIHGRSRRSTTIGWIENGWVEPSDVALNWTAKLDNI